MFFWRQITLVAKIGLYEYVSREFVPSISAPSQQGVIEAWPLPVHRDLLRSSSRSLENKSLLPQHPASCCKIDLIKFSVSPFHCSQTSKTFTSPWKEVHWELQLMLKPKECGLPKQCCRFIFFFFFHLKYCKTFLLA